MELFTQKQSLLIRMWEQVFGGWLSHCAPPPAARCSVSSNVGSSCPALPLLLRWALRGSVMILERKSEDLLKLYSPAKTEYTEYTGHTIS